MSTSAVELQRDIQSPRSPSAAIGKTLLIRAMSSSTDEYLQQPSPSLRLSSKSINYQHQHVDAADEEEVSSDETEREDDLRASRASRRRFSVTGAELASQVPPRLVPDTNFVVSPKYVLPSFDITSYKTSKGDLGFYYQAPDMPLTTVCRIVKLPKTLLGAATWQIYSGDDRPLAVIKQAVRSINPTFYIFQGSDAQKGSCVYTLLKKMRSSKFRVFSGEGCKDSALLSYFCMIGKDRVSMKTRDVRALAESMGETIVDWRQNTKTLRIGKGFDVLLACATFALADLFEPHNLDAPDEVHRRISGALQLTEVTEIRRMMGWT